MSDRGAGVLLHDGRLHLSAELHAGPLRGCDAVALLADEDGWLLVPLHAGAGGLQLKQRNARGDRVVECREFVRAQGIEDDAPPMRFALCEEVGRGAFRLVATNDR